jgi:cephalosporin hydroxylase
MKCAELSASSTKARVHYNVLHHDHSERKREMNKKTLVELYKEHDGKVSDKWSAYLAEYQRVFDEYRDRPVRLLEVGVQNGGSLDIWAEYFSKARKIVGCDIDPECRKLRYKDPRVAIVVGDANSNSTRRRILSHAARFDIVVDDGSHRSSDIVKTFALYFPVLVDGGVFIAEDLHCSYWQEYEGGLFDPYSAISFFKRLADIIHYEHWGIKKARADVLHGFFDRYRVSLDEGVLQRIHSVQFTNSMCVIRKALPEENQLGSRVVAGTEQDVMPLCCESKPLHRNQTENEWSERAMSLEEELLFRTVQAVDLQERLARLDHLGRLIELFRLSLMTLWILLSNPGELGRIIVRLFRSRSAWASATSLKDRLAREAELPVKLARGSIRVEVERPARRLARVGGKCVVSGWGVDLKAQSAAEVSLVIGRTAYRPERKERRDVRRRFGFGQHIPTEVGFETVLRIPAGIHRLRVKVLGSRGSSIVAKRVLLIRAPRFGRRESVSKPASPIPKSMSDLHDSPGAAETPLPSRRPVRGKGRSRPSIAVCYIARGKEADWRSSIERFCDSYNQHRPGLEHTLYVIYKGFPDASSLAYARELFVGIRHKPVFLADNAFDIGAYKLWANQASEELVCLFGTSSELLADDWLRKLATNLALPDVGLVGATGSYESLSSRHKAFPPFPNVHIRSNAFMIDRTLFCRILDQFAVTTKFQALLFESGPASMSRQVLDRGQKILVVGRNGKGYPPHDWPMSGTFRQGMQENLLVADKQTRLFAALDWDERWENVLLTWAYDVTLERTGLIG